MKLCAVLVFVCAGCATRVPPGNVGMFVYATLQHSDHPYKLGLVGSTDSHTALTAVEEDNFFGKTTSSEPSAERVPAHQ